MKVLLLHVFAVCLVLALLVGNMPADLPANAARLEVGKVVQFSAETPHPAPLTWKQTYSFPGAAFLRLHFKNFDLAPGDKLVISTPDSAYTWEVTGQGLQENGEFWSFAVDGESVTLELLAPSGQSYGFRIVEVGYGTIPLDSPLPIPEVICGTDGKEPIACHTDEPTIAVTQAPVARLLFAVKKSMYLCTGELVRGKYANTLITNNHCIDSQEVVSTLEARFNYQQIACDDTTLATPISFAGKKFLKTNLINYRRNFPSTGLDYTLLTLKGNAEATFGELIPTSAAIDVGDEINFIQHPGGLPKQIGYWEDADHVVRCKIDEVAVRYVSTYPDSQIAYGCDSAGGSSGSAITRAIDGKMIGLHHYGGVEDCLNSASMMSLICADAGDLLVCDSD